MSVVRISPKNWQLLSEYLDEQLNLRTQRVLEERLKNSAELRQGLDELRQVRQTLRAVKPRRVPRNFTLTAAMVARSNPIRSLWAPGLGFSSALATLVAIAALALHLLSPVRMAALPPQPAMEKSGASAAGSALAQLPPIILWAPGGMGGGGGGGNSTAPFRNFGRGQTPAQTGNGTALLPTAAPMGILVLPEATQTVPTQMQPTAAVDQTQVPSLGMPALLPTPTQPQPVAPTATQELPTAPAGSSPILGVAPHGSEGRIIPQADSAKAIESQQSTAENIWWLLPAGMGVLGLLLGILALAVSRRNSR